MDARLIPRGALTLSQEKARIVCLAGTSPVPAAVAQLVEQRFCKPQVVGFESDRWLVCSSS